MSTGAARICHADLLELRVSDHPERIEDLLAELCTVAGHARR
jgi:hypothetical protein